ncbi:MerR family transcriptional regulator [Stakelama marina]|uniref:Helix-turn-helix domain-containing protein n=1 Tax=Stakelama marina TaxID=2826939 RepID=A0A8T4IMT7_9SPHN|nr:helix-turn-helix domain-containing protein [Stakelama marina]MBR0553476.1 helix-turn-helix domain-containing protein [Stakelama marina]
MRIGEVARKTGVKAETIRFYEREGILSPPPRTGSNYRDYGPAEATKLTFIRRARELGFSMADIRELLDLSEDADRPCAKVDAIARSQLGKVESKLEALEDMRTELARMIASCDRERISDCRIIEALAK